jgi:hypothetical protein
MRKEEQVAAAAILSARVFSFRVKGIRHPDRVSTHQEIQIGSAYM